MAWRNSCCRAADGRVGTSFEYQSCLPAKNGKTFPSGAVCEPQSVVEANGWLGKAKQCARWFQNWAFIDFDRSEAFNFFLRADNGRLAVGAPGNKGYDYYETSGPSLADGRWHHAAFVLEPTGVLAIYRDAQPSTLNAQPGRDIGGGRQRYGFIGDGSEADTFDGRRNNIKFNGDIARVRRPPRRSPRGKCTTTSCTRRAPLVLRPHGAAFSPLHSYASSAIVATYVYEWCSEGSDLCREHMSDCAAACDANGHCGGATFRRPRRSPPQARCWLGSKGGWLRGRTQSDPNDWGYARPTSTTRRRRRRRPRSSSGRRARRRGRTARRTRGSRASSARRSRRSPSRGTAFPPASVGTTCRRDASRGTPNRFATRARASARGRAT